MLLNFTDDANAVEVPEVLEKSDDVEREPENGTELLLKNPELQALRQYDFSLLSLRSTNALTVILNIESRNQWSALGDPHKDQV